MVKIMQEKPIIFSTKMVQAILDGRKTQTRRVVKSPYNTMHYGTLLSEWGLSDQPYQWRGKNRFGRSVDFPWNWVNKTAPEIGDWIWELQCDVDDTMHVPLRCPGQVGDRLWVKEGWFNPSYEPGLFRYPHLTYYKADPPDQFKWKSARFMPKVYARLWLEITGIRVERLQDISNEDAWCEGVADSWEYDCIAYFKELWDSINSKKHPWSSNPWVWVIEFKPLDSPRTRPSHMRSGSQQRA